jgi:hypothetical protein
MQFFVESINRKNLLLTEIVTELKQRPARDRFTAACAAMQGMLADTNVSVGEKTATSAVRAADLLLAELAKGGGK